MEAFAQVDRLDPLLLPAGCFNDSADCPFCGATMAELTEEEVACLNDNCPFVTSKVLHDVLDGLIELGHDPLRAAQIAAMYSIDEEYPVLPGKSAITDMSSADRVLSKMSAIQCRIDNTQTMIDNDLEAISKRGERLLTPLRNQLEFYRIAFGEQLAEWTRKEIAGQKAKSVKLLHGKVGFRKAQDALVIESDERAVLFTEDAGFTDCIRKTISRTALRKRVEAGDIPSDVARIEPGEDKFYIDPESLVA